MEYRERDIFDDEDEEYDVDTCGDDTYEDDSEPTIDCPYCGEQILETTPRCPHCGHYISEEDIPPRKKSWLIVVGVGLCLYVVYLWITG
jgi:DNA-directed RNA polymerase subunit RPC12/RpoP